MEHFIFFFYILSFSSGIAACNVALLLYMQHKKVSVRYYSILQFSLVLIIASYILTKYISIVSPMNKAAIHTVSDFVMRSGFILLICVMPFFSHSIMGIEMSRFKKRLFTGVDILVVINMSLILFRFFNDSSVTRQIEFFIIDPLLALVTLYSIYMIVADFNSISEKTVKNAFLGFLILTVVFFPVYIIEGYRFEITALRDYKIIEIFSLPLYFLILNTLSMIFSIRYYNQPAFWKNNTLSDYFREKYKITEREETIIGCIIEGLSNSQISSRLFISGKTVENHLSNIYSKLNVKNRVQLVSLILSNR